LIRDGGKGVDDHYIQRSLCMEIIFMQLNNNPDMSVDEFIGLLRKYSSTVLLSEKEHRDITIYTKNKSIMNYIAYGDVGIEVKGLMDIIDSSPVFN
jgi:hypothetical protein